MANQLSGVVRTVREDRDEFILLAFVALVVALVFLQTRGLLPRTRQVPIIIASMLVVILALTVFMKFFGDQFQELTGWEPGGSGILDEIDEGSSGDETEHLFDLNPKKVTKHFAWLVLYLVGLVFVGFWTTNILFPLVYIMKYETSPLPRRFVYYLLCTGVIVGTLWILFVELLNVQSIWRLGFLP